MFSSTPSLRSHCFSFFAMRCVRVTALSSLARRRGRGSSATKCLQQDHKNRLLQILGVVKRKVREKAAGCPRRFRPPGRSGQRERLAAAGPRRFGLVMERSNSCARIGGHARRVRGRWRSWEETPHPTCDGLEKTPSQATLSPRERAVVPGPLPSPGPRGIAEKAVIGHPAPQGG